MDTITHRCRQFGGGSILDNLGRGPWHKNLRAFNFHDSYVATKLEA